jgi:signal transduction histidine kinase
MPKTSIDIASTAGQSKTILVVDDDPHIVALLDEVLSLKGFNVVGASSVGECGRCLQMAKPDLLLVDYQLPDGNGLDVVKAAITELPYLAVIMMTGVAIQDVQVAAHAIRLGAIEYLTKPFDLEVLESLVLRSLKYQEEKRQKFLDSKSREAFPRHLLSLLEEERRHLALELHDELGQTLSTLKMDVELLMDECGGSDLLAERLVRLMEKLSLAIEQVRGISYGLRPFNLDALGLEPALRLLLDDMTSKAQLQAKSFLKGLEDRCEGGLELAVYRIVQEGLTNVVRHSGASHVSLNVIRGQEKLSIILEDDGKGFDSEKCLYEPGRINGLGLLSMRERAEQFDGKLWIDSRVGHGTCVSVEIPLRQNHSAVQHSSNTGLGTVHRP